MHPDLKPFSIEVPIDDPVKMDEFSKAMAAQQEAHIKYIGDVAKELGINEDAANDIVYLRGRSRWTQEKEDYLVKLAKEGKPLPNIME